MKILRRLPSRPPRWRKLVAAIGIFDGVHRGHQAILKRALLRARAIRGTPVAVTFYPHPLAVLAPQLLPQMLLSLRGRLEAFANLGIRAALVIPFNRAFSRLSPESFVECYLGKGLGVREVVVGHDFGFGVGRSGTIETLRELGRRFSFKIHVVPPVRVRGERIASHRIRGLIAQGDLRRASLFLGRPVTVEGEVVRGSGRGKGLGFPTANLKVEAGVLPLRGVYAVLARMGRRAYAGMANVGIRPTFKRIKKLSTDGAWHQLLKTSLEVHLFGAKGSLYGRKMVVTFLRRLRAERRFPSAQALVRQLAQDARRASKVWTSPPKAW